jgi:hypothetical protein
MLSAIRRRVRVTSALTAALTVAIGLRAVAQQAPTVPSKLADTTFWRLVTEFSEDGGSFRSDNFVSNETTFQYVIPRLQQLGKQGGVYLGVGPEQNFTYIVALKPKIAFIFDIRRQNMLTHLMYKALVEESADRAEFLSRLFSRPRPPTADTLSKIYALFVSLEASQPDSIAFRRNFAAVKDRLIKHHGFKLSDDDLRTLEYVYTAFYYAGPDVNYNYGNNNFGRMGSMPSYTEVMVATDETGLQRSYLASEANFRTLKQLHHDNLIVPLVGDFAGPKAIRAVGRWLRDRNSTVTAFYTSNVEQYLFQDSDTWRRFFGNVGTLPVDSASTFIRAFFNQMGGYRGPGGPRSTTMLGSIAEQVKLVNDGRLASYFDLMNYSKP